MRFQRRDHQILTAIYEYGGVLSRSQVKEMFWPDKSWRAMEVRLAKLRETGYITWPDASQRREKPIPTSIIWLGAKGVLVVAQSRGAEVETPKKQNENQLRKLEKSLREQGIHWMREPAWSQLGHDLTLVDIRRAFENASQNQPDVRLGEWIDEHTFRKHPDQIEYQLAGRGVGTTKKREIIPDGVFSLIDLNRQVAGRPHVARFLVELDMATHSNPNFGRFKAAPYAAYIGSKPFLERFGGKTARWLVITSGSTRLGNLMQQCRKHAGKKASVFLFTTIKDVLSSNPLTDTVWRSPVQKEKRSILRGETT